MRTVLAAVIECLLSQTRLAMKGRTAKYRERLSVQGNRRD
jgi:hypothetical protein